jgi:hypothetical protein
MFPEARMMAMRSLPPDIPTVDFLTREYFLYLFKPRHYLKLLVCYILFTKIGIKFFVTHKPGKDPGLRGYEKV